MEWANLAAMRSLIFAVLLMSSFAFGQAQETPPDIDGYVTSVSSTSDFAVDGTHVVCDAKTHYRIGNGQSSATIPWANGPYLGQSLKVFGKKNHKSQTLNAKEIVLAYPRYTDREGFAVIDRVLSADAGQGKQIVVRADGYPILIDSKTNSYFTPPLTSLADIATNVWIEFKGEQQPDGVIVAAQAVFTKNTVAGNEGKLRSKTEYDPAKVDPQHAQGEVSKLFVGTKAKRIPPYKDAANQARIERVGASLIPQYQRALPVTDPTKINFRFQLVDIAWKYAFSMPSGVVLVPIDIVDRMQNDAQLAAILADAMANSLEKRDYREQPAMHAIEATEWAADGTGFLVPGLDLMWLGGSIARSNIERHNQERSARVSLGLLQDAQYDLSQAPLAWWLLASSKPKDLTNVTIPEHARYLYEVLGTTWKTGHMATR
jgi:hypothetical protein